MTLKAWEQVADGSWTYTHVDAGSESALRGLAASLGLTVRAVVGSVLYAR